MENATAVKKPGFFARLRQRFTLRSGTVKPSSPFSAWQRLFSSWGIKKPLLSVETAQSIPALSRAVNVVADQLASLPIDVIETTEDGSNTILHDDPLHRLLKFRPHPMFSSYDFMAALIRRLMFAGEVCVHPVMADGIYTRLDLICEKPDVFESQGQYFYRFSGINGTFPAATIWHFKINTIDGLSGQGLIDLFPRTLERALAEIQQGHAYFTNGGQVSGLLTPSQQLTDKQAKQAMDFWSTNNEGADKVGKVGMVPFGFNYIKLGDSIADSKLLEARRMTVHDISNMTGVHPILLADLNRATLGNTEELNRILVQFTLRSVAKVIEDEINSKGFAERDWGKRYVKINFEGLLRGDIKARAEYYTKLFNIHSINPNEIRKLEGRDPYEGGDEFGKPFASNIKTDQTDGQQTNE